jgi:hypothetical protein
MSPHSVTVALVLATLVAGHGARAACRSTCTEELRACRAECARTPGAERRQCRRRCDDASTCSAPGARVRTIAYVVAGCRQDASGFTFNEKLVVRRGNCDPVTLMELPPAGPVADPMDLCRAYGRFRIGGGSVVAGRFQRVGVTPKGRRVVFEVTNDHSLFPYASPEPPEEGIFIVRADGTGRQRIGEQTKRPIIDVVSTPGGPAFRGLANPIFAFSPSGRYVDFEDYGPGPDGAQATQIFVLEPKTGERTQVTHLASERPGASPTCCPFFADDHRIVFYNGAEGRSFSVGIDGSGLRPTTNGVTIEGAVIDPQFGLASIGTNAIPVRLPRLPKRTYRPGDTVRELFIIDGKRALQLTAFDYPDTAQYTAVGSDRVYFVASAERFGTNPRGVCQLFSIAPFGGGLRQLTRFPDDGRPKRGCLVAAPDVSCRVSGIAADTITGAVTFISSCDPLGRNPNGEQFFVMRPDGSGIRQISAFRGVENLPDGSVTVEMAGPVEYSLTAH